jgi:hypothetical protein
LYALDAVNGNLLWRYTTDDKVVSSPAVANGVVYFGSYDHLVYAVGSPVQSTEIEPDQSFIILVLTLVLAVLVVGFLGLFLFRRKHQVRQQS